LYIGYLKELPINFSVYVMGIKLSRCLGGPTSVTDDLFDSITEELIESPEEVPPVSPKK
jgi:hypothetical protein